MTSQKSSGFDRNLNSKPMKSQIQQNLYKSEEILFQASNQIAPFDPNRRTGSHLRQDTSLAINGMSLTRTWNKDYAGERYVSNNKNPHTTRWIEKGEAKTRAVRLNIAAQNVVK